MWLCALVCIQTLSLLRAVLRLVTEPASPDEGSTPDGDALTSPAYRQVSQLLPFGSVWSTCAQRPGLPRAFHSSYFSCLALQVVLSADGTLAPRARLRQSFPHTLISQ